MMSVAAVSVSVVMVMSVRIFEKKRADQIDQKTNSGNPNRLIEPNGHRYEEPVNGFSCHQDCDDGEHNRARKAAEHTHLSSSKTVAWIVPVTTTEIVGECRDREGGNVCAHVPAIRQQGH